MHYRHVASFSDNDIEKSPWAARKAWTHDTLAYRGNNIWKCISVQEEGEGCGEGVSSAKTVYKESYFISLQSGLIQIQNSTMRFI